VRGLRLVAPGALARPAEEGCAARSEEEKEERNRDAPVREEVGARQREPGRDGRHDEEDDRGGGESGGSDERAHDARGLASAFVSTARR
jgi:hypothetical protein